MPLRVPVPPTSANAGYRYEGDVEIDSFSNKARLSQEILDDIAAGGGGSAHIIKDNGTSETARAALNFVSSSTITLSCTDDSGGDETEVTAVLNSSVDLDNNARVGVRKNSTGSTFERRRINLIEGSNVTLTVADDSGDEEVDVTIAATSSTSIDRRANYEVYEDFDYVNFLPASLPTTGQHQMLFSTGWEVFGSASAPAATGGIARILNSESGHPGILRLTTGTGDNTNTRLSKTAGFVGALAAGGAIHYGDVSSIVFVTRSISNTSMLFSMALQDPSNGNNSVLFYYDTDSAATLDCITRLIGFSTTTSVTVPTANTWHTYELVLGPSSVVFKIDGSTVATHTTSLPTTATLSPTIQTGTRTTALKEFDVDLVWLRSNTLTR